MFKRWAVRQFADAVGDYLEGVTSESVVGKLGLDTGTLHINARLNPAVLRPLGLELLHSEVDLKANIPWRKLSSKPTEFHVTRLVIQTRLLAPDEREAPLDPAARRAHKEEAIRKVEDAIAEELAALKAKSETTASPGMVARLSHAVLRQLRVTLESVEVELQEGAAGEPFRLTLDRATLRSVGPDWVSAAPEDQEDLQKIFEISGLSAGLPHAIETTEPTIGPLALEVRLLHSPARQLLQICGTTMGDTIAVRLGSDFVRFANRCIECLPSDAEASEEVLGPDAGHEYALIYERRLQGEPHDESRFQEIEDTAPVAWIIAWRGYVRKLHEAQRLTSDDSTEPLQSTWKSWMFSSSAASAASSKKAEPGIASPTDFEALFEDVTQAGLVPEVALPSRVDLQVKIPGVEAFIFAGHSSLRAVIRGVVASADANAKAPVVCQTAMHLWTASVFLSLASLSLRLDDDDELVTLRQAEEDTMAGVPSVLFASETIDTRGALILRVEVSQRDARVRGDPALDIVVLARKDPIEIRLGARSVNRALALCLTVAKASAEKRGKEDRCTTADSATMSPSATMSRRPSQAMGRRQTTFAMPEGEITSTSEAIAFAAALADEGSTLNLDLQLQAPIVRWQLGNDVSIAIRLGSLSLRTCAAQDAEAARLAIKGMPCPRSVTMGALSCACELKDTSVAVVRATSEQWIYEPSTVALAYKLESDGATSVQVHAHAHYLRLCPEFARLVGHLMIDIGYAMSPLNAKAVVAEKSFGQQSTMRSTRTRKSEPGFERTKSLVSRTSSSRSTSNGASNVSSISLRAAVTFDSFEFSWGDSGAKPRVLAKFGQTTATVEQRVEVTSAFVSLARLSVEAGGVTMLSVEDAVSVNVANSAPTLDLVVDAAPVSVRLAAGPLKVVLGAAQAFQDEFAAGQAFGKMALPTGIVDADVDAVRLLWETVAEIGEDVSAYVQEELNQFGMDLPVARKQSVFAGLDRKESSSVQSTASFDDQTPGDFQRKANKVKFSRSEPRREAAQQAITAEVKLSKLSLRLEPDATNVGAEAVEIVAVDKSVVVTWRSSGAKVAVSLASVILDVGSRRILMPRRGDVDLLSLAARAGPGMAPSVELSWAQVALVFRYRDIDAITALISEDILGAMRKDAEVSMAPVASARSMERLQSAHALQYSFSVGAPLMFIPTDAYSVREPEEDLETMRHATSLDEFLGEGIHNCIVLKDGVPRFNPAPGDSYLAMDLGHLEIQNSGENIDIKLRETNLFSGHGTGPLREMLSPLAVSISVGGNKVICRSTDPSTVTLTRAQATLMLDVYWVNICYASADAQEMFRKELQRRKETGVVDKTVLVNEPPKAETEPSQQVPNGSADDMDKAKSATSEAPFLFSIGWEGPLALHVSFTDDTPLARLALVDGMIDYTQTDVGFGVDFSWKDFRVSDSRKTAKHSETVNLHMDTRGEERGFRLIYECPGPNGAESLLDFELNRPVLVVLPQLFSDIFTWLWSSYACSPYAQPTMDIALPVVSVGNENPWMVTRLRLPDPVIQIPTRWGQSAEHFEVTFGLSVSLRHIENDIYIDALDVEGAKLSRVAPGEPKAQLCSRLGVSAKGISRSWEDVAKSQRSGSLDLEYLTVRPFWLRLSMTDCGALAQALTELSEADSASAEPAAEVRLRDPLATVMQTRSKTCCNLSIGDSGLRLLDDAVGGIARPALEVAFGCPLVRLELQSATGELSSASVAAGRIDIGVKSYNDRAGVWEPVLMPTTLKLDMHTQLLQGEGRTLHLGDAGAALDPTFSQRSVARAWYGDEGSEWSEKAGRNVTEAVKALLSEGMPVTVAAAHELWGNGHTLSKRVLLVEVQEEPTVRLTLSSSPIHVVLTAQFAQLVTKLSPSPSMPAKARYGQLLLGLNLSGVPCSAGLGSKAGVPDIVVEPSSVAVPLDALYHDWDGTSFLPRLFLALPGRRDVPFGIFLEAESSSSWTTSCGELLVRVLAPKSSQRLLLVSSRLCVMNRTPLDIEVRFVSGDTGQLILAGTQPRCAPAALITDADDIQAGAAAAAAPDAASASLLKRESGLGGGGVVVRGQSGVLVRGDAGAIAAPASARTLQGEIVLGVLRAVDLDRPTYRVGNIARSLISGQVKIAPYVVVEAGRGQRPAETATGTEDVVGVYQFGTQLKFPLPQGATQESMCGREVEFRVHHRVPAIQASLRGDPLIGVASFRLGAVALGGESQWQSLTLYRDGKARGRLEVTVRLDASEVDKAPRAVTGSSGPLGARPPFSTAEHLEADELRRECARLGLPTAASEAKDDLVRILAESGQPFLAEEVHCVPAGHIFSAPVEVADGKNVQLQCRPADKISYKWGKLISIDALSEGLISCSSPERPTLNLPSCSLHVQAHGMEDKWCEISIEAPFRLANACPCALYFCLGIARGGEQNATEPELCDARELVRVMDGHGGHWEIPPESIVTIHPLALEQGGLIYWYLGNEKRQVGPCWSKTMCANVVRRGNTIQFQCKEVNQLEAFSTKMNPFRLGPQEELPLFDVPPDVLFGVALREQVSQELSTWSSPLPVVAPATAASRLTVIPRMGEEKVVLGVLRQAGRRSVVYAEHWFADATGLGAGLHRRRDAVRLASFGKNVTLLGRHAGEKEADTPQVYISLPGGEPVAVSVPLIGGSARVALSAVHDCALKVEPIDTGATFGVLCKLLTVVPGVMAFSRVKNCEVGIRQEGCADALWLGCDGSSHLYWSRADRPKSVEISVRPLGSQSRTPLTVSAPFPIAKRGIGSFPMAFPGAGSELIILCLQVDQVGDVATIAIGDASECHHLVNKHPGLALEGFFENEGSDGERCFAVAFDERRALGSSPSKGPLMHGRFTLQLTDAQDGSRSVRRCVSLVRASSHTVQLGLLAAVIEVEIRARVALVSVRPVATGAVASQIDWGSRLDVRLPSVTISLVGERPRGEVFAVTLGHMTAIVHQTANAQRKVDFEVKSLQVDLQRPKPQVVLASAKDGVFLHMRIIRDDIASGEVVIRSVRLALGYLEATLEDDTLHEVMHLAEAALPGHMGLGLAEVLARAGVPYNLVCNGPPAPSDRYVVRDVYLSKIRVRLFCQLSLGLLPNALTALLTVLSGFASVMSIDGAIVELQEQQFFDNGHFEGSLGACVTEMSSRLTPTYMKALLSLLTNSNLLLGGLLGRHAFFPKARRVQEPCRPPVRVERGVVDPELEDILSFISG